MLAAKSAWCAQVAKKIDIPFHEVDAHNVVPCWLASDKREYGARTIRSKIHKKLPEFLHVRSLPFIVECLLKVSSTFHACSCKSCCVPVSMRV